MGSRAGEFGARFGARHPRLAVVMCGVLLLGIIAACSYQLSYGTYLDPAWAIAASAGAATAVAFAAATWISALRHPSAASRSQLAWLVLTALSASSLRYPFPLGHYGSVQAFFNVVHAALLGYEAVTCAAIVALCTFLLARSRGLPGLAALRQPSVPAAGPHVLSDDAGQVALPHARSAHPWPGWVLAGAVFGFLAGVILAAAAGPRAHDAQSTTAGFLILLALAAVCVAVPVLLYRRHRARRASAARSLPIPSHDRPSPAPDDWP